MPAESGPRLAICVIIAPRCAPRRSSTAGCLANSPTIPHISGSSRDSAAGRPVDGDARQGRRHAGIPLGFQGSRTPLGGDRRPSISGGLSREGALLLEELEVAVELPLRDLLVGGLDPPPLARDE